MLRKPLLIGITGGSGSGKTTLARGIVEMFPSLRVIIVPQDAYYRDLKHFPESERCLTNFDHPDAFDDELLMEQLNPDFSPRAKLECEKRN